MNRVDTVRIAGRSPLPPPPKGSPIVSSARLMSAAAHGVPHPHDAHSAAGSSSSHSAMKRVVWRV